jgi:hypothetical protein
MDPFDFVSIATTSRTFVLQTPLKSTGADMKRIGDVLNIGTPAGEFLLYRYSNTLDEVLVAVLLELNETAYLLGIQRRELIRSRFSHLAS